MKLLRHFFVSCLLPCLWLGGVPLAQAATTPPYDTAADTPAELQRALAQAGTEHKHVLLVFGANWCMECHALDMQMSGEALAARIARDYIVLKVDVARFNKNTDLIQHTGNPVRKGVPALAVLNAQGNPVKTVLATELASARRRGDAALLEMLHGLLPASP